MGLIRTISGTTTSQWWNCTLKVYEDSTNAIDNTSSVTLVAYIGRVNTTSYMQGFTVSITLNTDGQTASKSYSSSGRVDFPVGEGIEVARHTFTITHGSDGKKSIDASFSFTNNISPSSGSASGTSIQLTDIDRSAPSVSYSTTNIQPNSFTLSAWSPVSCDVCQYSLNGGNWTSFICTGQTIGGLTENTQYSVQVRLRKTSNQVYGYSGVFYITTQKEQSPPPVSYNITNITPNSFILSAWSSVNCDMYQYSLNGGAWTNFTSGQTISNLVPNTTYTMQVRLRKSYNQVWGYSETFNVTTIGGVLSVKVGGVWKTGIPYIKIDGTWKQGIAYNKINNSWRIGR